MNLRGQLLLRLSFSELLLLPHLVERKGFYRGPDKPVLSLLSRPPILSRVVLLRSEWGIQWSLRPKVLGNQALIDDGSAAPGCLVLGSSRKLTRQVG